MKKKKEKKRIGNFDIEDNKLDKGIVISLLIILYTPSVFSWAKSLPLILKISSTYRTQLFEGRLALDPGLNLTRISFSCVQKHFLG